VIRLSQWFIMVCLWLYCTFKDTELTVTSFFIEHFASSRSLQAIFNNVKKAWRYQSGNQKRKSMNDIQHNYNERKRTKEQTMIYTTLHRKQKIAWHEAKNKTKKHLGDLICSIMVSNSCSTSGTLPANNCKLRFIGFSQS
jgi:biopolymer transport protein ExbB/TolQ